MKKHYKVVAKSLWSARYIGRSAVRYKIGEWVDAPDNTRLFVFDSLKEARKFHEQGEDIYECEVRGGIKLPGCAWVGSISAFWEKFNTKIKNKEKITREYMEKELDLAKTPAVLVKSVKLKKLVPNK